VSAALKVGDRVQRLRYGPNGQTSSWVHGHIVKFSKDGRTAIVAEEGKARRHPVGILKPIL
jgi:hypothetical protein